jgi:hypothetical protein
LKLVYDIVSRVHWHEGGSTTCLTYSNENVKAEVCLLGSSNLPEAKKETRKGENARKSKAVRKVETVNLKTPKNGEKSMKISLKSKVLSWVKVAAISALMGLSGTPSLQPNAL